VRLIRLSLDNALHYDAAPSTPLFAFLAQGRRSTWRHRAKCLTVLGLPLLIVGCTQNGAGTKQDPLQAFGLIRSRSQEALIERAVVISNITLSDDVPFRFQLTWTESGLHPRFVFPSSARRDHPRLSVEHVEDEYRYRDAIAIPVYLIDDDRLGAYENVFVPDGCRCVFVNCRSVDPLLDAFGIGEKTALLRYSEYERASVYATALLHEMGICGTATQEATPSRPGSHRLMLPPALTIRRTRKSMPTALQFSNCGRPWMQMIGAPLRPGTPGEAI